MKRLHESPVPTGELQNVNVMNLYAGSLNNGKKAIVDNSGMDESNSAFLVTPNVNSIKSMPFFTHPNSAFRPVVPMGDMQKECMPKSTTSGQRRVKPSADNDSTCVFEPIKLI